MRTIFASLARAHERVLVQNVRAFPQTKLDSEFYNNCLISCALIGSFLSSRREQTDKILMHTRFQVQLSAVKLSTF